MRSVIIFLCILLIYAKCEDNYNKRRKQLLELEMQNSLGGKMTLSGKEYTVNNCLMQHKFNEVDYGFNNPDKFNQSHHFFKYKDSIHESKVYKIIKSMPKGGVLHVHDMALIGPDYFLNITYMDYLYVCFDPKIKFWFSNNIPNISCESHWLLTNEARRASGNITQFDASIRKQFTMVVENPEVVYPSINKTWSRFKDYFYTVSPLLTYRPNWEKYLYDALTLFKKDNVMYIETRSILPKLYELNGTRHDRQITVNVYRETLKRFVEDHPDFIGAKVIFAPSRRVDKHNLDRYINITRQIKKDVPDLIAGFDLVGQESRGNLIEFVPQLLTAQDLNFFFHAGETNWFGTLTDENLVDAILLGAKRIGHAYALAKHPVLIQEVIDKDIGLEVNVLSNTVLSLVKDVRNHPLNIFLSLNLPVVLSSDDPGAWEADPISDDFYVAFVGVASRLSDLRMLKTLAINSLKYSALEPADKERALRSFDVKWNYFIDKFDCKSY